MLDYPYGGWLPRVPARALGFGLPMMAPDSHFLDEARAGLDALRAFHG
jgi:hypothetical protein